MKRRNFLSILGAAGVAPVLPVPPAASPTAAGYNRYMYGLAVFQARTRASLAAADLVAKLRVAPSVADAMMGEMRHKGVLAPALNGAAGAMRAVSPTAQRKSMLRRAARRVVDHVIEDRSADQAWNPQDGRDGATPADQQ